MEYFETIRQNGEAEIEEKKSRFIANIYHVETIEEAENKLKAIRKKYFDAKHHCYAYRLVEKMGIKEKQSDDGEPSGTAGAPMLNILQKNELVNVLVVITRYFGGTLLGTGGLVRAYSDATLKALEKSGREKRELGYAIKIAIEYKDLEKFKYYCRKHKILIVNTVYEKDIVCTLELTKQEKIELLEKKQIDIPIRKSCVIEEKYIRSMIE